MRKSRKALTAHVLRIVDGDTILVNVAWWPVVLRRQRVRIGGINAPEMNTIEGQEAKQALKRILKEKDTVKLRNIQRGKYGRLVCSVEAAGADVATHMLKLGHAQAWTEK